MQDEDACFKNCPLIHPVPFIHTKYLQDQGNDWFLELLREGQTNASHELFPLNCFIYPSENHDDSFHSTKISRCLSNGQCPFIF